MLKRIFSSLILVMVLILLAQVSLIAADQKNNNPPIGYWKFDEGAGEIAKDSSGQGNDGKVYNLGTCSQWVDGRVGFALAFTEKTQGNCGFVDVPNIGKYDFTKGITIEAWMKPQGTTSADNILCNQINERSPGIRVLYYGGSVGEVIFPTYGLDGKSWSVTTHPRISFVEGVWYHIACICEDGILKIYIDGEEIKSSEETGAIIGKGSDILTIGAYMSGAAYGFNGIIDEVKIYDYPRSPLDIVKDALLR
ncbi:MAG: LamG domain-containing protein [bacterium]|nr:LamG domain-containing protein [bacterium]